jgi:hypothetical protein
MTTTIIPPKRGRGRPRTGSVSKHEDHLDVRITMPDGTRSAPRCLPAGTSLARAREIAAALTEREIEKAKLETASPVPQLETLSAWSDRWCDDREARGLTSVKDDRGRLRKWILPVIGTVPVATFHQADLERLVERLDEQVRAEELSWKTAKNAWGLVT